MYWQIMTLVVDHELSKHCKGLEKEQKKSGILLRSAISGPSEHYEVLGVYFSWILGFTVGFFISPNVCMPTRNSLLISKRLLPNAAGGKLTQPTLLKPSLSLSFTHAHTNTHTVRHTLTFPFTLWSTPFFPFFGIPSASTNTESLTQNSTHYLTLQRGAAP